MQLWYLVFPFSLIGLAAQLDYISQNALLPLPKSGACVTSWKSSSAGSPAALYATLGKTALVLYYVFHNGKHLTYIFLPRNLACFSACQGADEITKLIARASLWQVSRTMCR